MRMKLKHNNKISEVFKKKLLIQKDQDKSKIPKKKWLRKKFKYIINI